MRIYDPRLGRFLSVDPLTKRYPELTPYQFASNRPIDGIDLDGLEFYKINDAYVMLSITYDAMQKKVSATVVFRTNQKKVGTMFGEMVLPGKLNEYISNSNSSTNSIGSNAAQVATIQIIHNSPLVKNDANSSMSDVEELPKAASPSEYRTPVVPRNKREMRELQRSREFYT